MTRTPYHDHAYLSLEYVRVGDLVCIREDLENGVHIDESRIYRVLGTKIYGNFTGPITLIDYHGLTYQGGFDPDQLIKLSIGRSMP
jgi:hypothetical protein